MKIGFCGLGKLGLPCALAIANAGHQVYGFDINPEVRHNILNRHIPYKEEGAQQLMDRCQINLRALEEVIEQSEILFVPIQTPHDPKFEGTARVPDERVDFNYKFLKHGLKRIAEIARDQKKDLIVVVISTVLPGTIEKEIKPVLNHYIHLVYNPFFIAMGTTIPDFINPEFVLMGVDEEDAATIVSNFYKTIHSKPVFKTSIKTAELTKVAYNTFIGFKITFINAMMEICHKTGASIDDLSNALKLATDRIISPKYLRGGMGDGGGCHPRDNIALSFLAKKLRLSHDIFADLMQAREDQTDWLASLIEDEYIEHDLPVFIWGKAYKPESNLTVGSPATLLANLLYERSIPFTHEDPYIDASMEGREIEKGIYFIATKHQVFAQLKFPKGSLIIDPFRYIPEQEGVKIISIGNREVVEPIIFKAQGEQASYEPKT